MSYLVFPIYQWGRASLGWYSEMRGLNCTRLEEVSLTLNSFVSDFRYVYVKPRVTQRRLGSKVKARLRTLWFP